MFFNLSKNVTTSSAVAEEDMLPLKIYLKKFGAYDVPAYGMTKYPDSELFEGIKTYQCKEFDAVQNKGPLPEGKWLVRQSQHQNFYKNQNLKDRIVRVASAGIAGKWPGGKDSWGNNRVWLELVKGTDNKNRTNLSIHGGKEYGSSGCIDLTDKMDEFTDRFKKYGHDMILNVKYDDDCW